MKRRKRVQLSGRTRIMNPRNAFYELRVFYDGGLNESLDHALFHAVGKISQGSGCFFAGAQTRDHEWEFVKSAEALAAARRIVKATQAAFRITGVPIKVRVEVWDIKPKQIFAAGGPQ